MMTIMEGGSDNTDILAFLGMFYKHSKTYRVGLNQLKNNYQRYNNTYYTDFDFAECMNALGFKKNKNDCYKIRENKKAIWGKGGLMNKHLQEEEV